MQIDQPYLVKHTTQQVRATITNLQHRVDINDLSACRPIQLELNEIGVVSMETHRPLSSMPYRQKSRNRLLHSDRSGFEPDGGCRNDRRASCSRGPQS